MNDRIAEYHSREEELEQAAGRLERRSRNGSLLRLFVFIAGLGLLIYLYTDLGFLPGLAGTLAFIIGFGLLINWHLKLSREQEHIRRMILINQREQDLLRYEFDSTPDHGGDLLDTNHENAIDLDLFGPFSFFHFLNRTGTSIGRRRLADFLLYPADKKTILLRQTAIRELAEERDWRQHFQAEGQLTADDPTHVSWLQKWMTDPYLVRNNRIYRISFFLAPILSLAGLLAWVFYLPWYGAILFLSPQILIIRRTLKRVNEIHQQTMDAGEVLGTYANMCSRAEMLTPASEHLAQQVQILKGDGVPASRSIKKLSYLIAQLNVRMNPFAIFLNLFGLWDLHWIHQLEKWKEKRSDNLTAWFDALAEIEALQSLGTLSDNFPQWAFPEIREEDQLDSVALGHPLLPQEVGVTNDFSLPVSNHIKLITGSNMAGKSTFLRTVGLNLVLAMSGAPVCARSMQLPLLRVFTSMRTQDALHESTSSFFAELKRLKFIIEAVEARPRPAHQPFFLLDEILKGTNSRDRHRGSRALINQLLKAGSAGLIATHDLELGDMAEQSDGAIENQCMEVEIRNGELFFDYKLKPGVSQSFNATHLMQKMGIRVEE